ncbi:uncharacterized protein LOC114534825 [Dendronephthya gigantea]|uniref:uncharacterized protein LOC114534825 n=1 Tax=Dendronephthya gigantea TaxID=151771 RepID=UPI00106B0487|nr:uncharacterized protein LOC114534825 [Dendronephthya gigantea]
MFLNEGLPRMFADDTNISFQSNNFDDLERVMNTELEKNKKWLNVNKLSLNIAKTEFMVIGSRQRLSTFDDHDINVIVDKKQIEKVESTKSLGLSIDENLTWKKHIDDISKKVSSGISALKRIRSFVNQDTAVRVYQGLIEPYFSYCAPVWDGIGSKLSDKLQKLQNRAARVITCSPYDASSSSVLEKLGWNNLHVNRKMQKAILMYKVRNNLTPMYLQDLFVTRVNHYSLRNTNGKLFVPKPKTDYLKRSFSFSGASIWNSLPEPLRLSESLSSFKRSLRINCNSI